MKAMLFAAGLGTRLKPFTDEHPKALAPVLGKTLLERNIRYLQQYGIYDIVVNVYHFAEQIIDTLQRNEGFGSRYQISDESGAVLETGGGLKYAAPLLMDEDLVAMNVDVLTTLPLSNLIKAHKNSKAFATLAVMDRPSSRKLIFSSESQLVGWRNELTGEQRPVVEPIPEPFFLKAFSGIQVLRKEALAMNDFPQKFSIIDMYLKRAATEKVMAYDHSGDVFLDVGKPESLQQAAVLFG